MHNMGLSSNEGQPYRLKALLKTSLEEDCLSDGAQQTSWGRHTT